MQCGPIRMNKLSFGAKTLTKVKKLISLNRSNRSVGWMRKHKAFNEVASLANTNTPYWCGVSKKRPAFERLLPLYHVSYENFQGIF